MDLPEIDFGRIRAMGSGGRREAFEQFVCELAAEERPHADVVFTRVHGAGGDGGVECFWALLDGDEHGWRAKFGVDSRNVDRAQFDESVSGDGTQRPPSAGEVHHRDSGGPDWTHGGRGKSLRESVRYWFDVDVVTDAWWQNRFDDAIQAARLRYVPELSIDVPAVAAIAVLCGDPAWRAALTDQITALQGRLVDVRSAADDALVADLAAVWGTGGAVVTARVRAHGDLGCRWPTLYPAQVGIGRGGQFTLEGAGLWVPRGSGWLAVAAHRGLSIFTWRSSGSSSPAAPSREPSASAPWGSARQVRTLADAATTTGTTYPSFDVGPASRIVTLLAVLLLTAGTGPHSVLLHRGKGDVVLAARRIVVRCP